MFKKLTLMLLAAMVLAGCYWNYDVEQSEVGAQFKRNTIVNCVGAGLWSDTSWYADIQKYSVATLTFEVNDPEVATSDNQLVGVTVTIQARRKGDCDSVKSFFSNWTHLLDDTILLETIDATAREGIKNGTRLFTLTQLLNDRNGLSNAITEQLEQDASKYNVDVVNVTIENVALDPAYVEILQQTASLNAQQDQALRQQALIEQQAETELFKINQAITVANLQAELERAQTEVDVEIARREGEVIAASNQVYEQNSRAYSLAVLEKLSQIFDGKTVYFVPEGTDLTTLFGVNGIVPIAP